MLRHFDGFQETVSFLAAFHFKEEFIMVYLKQSIRKSCYRRHVEAFDTSWEILNLSGTNYLLYWKTPTMRLRFNLHHNGNSSCSSSDAKFFVEMGAKRTSWDKRMSHQCVISRDAFQLILLTRIYESLIPDFLLLQKKYISLSPNHLFFHVLLWTSNGRIWHVLVQIAGP